MFRMKSIFNCNYFRYSFRKTLPMIIAMNVIIVMSTFVIYFNTDSTYTFRFGDVFDFSYVLGFFMYIYPVFLGISMFGFMFSKKRTDFVGALPVTRSSIFFTNTVIGAASIFITCVLNITIAIMISVFKCGNNIYIAPQVYFYSFFFWFIAYMVMFLMVSVSCVLSGTLITSLMLTFVLAFSPFISRILIEINIYGYPIENKFNFSAPSGVLLSIFGYYFKLMQTLPYILYNILICILLIALGMYYIRRREYETAEDSYANKIILNIVRFGIYIPATIGLWTATKNFDFSVLILIVFIFIGFFICEVILNKGIRKGILKGLSIFGISAAVSLIFVIISAFLGNSSTYYHQSTYIYDNDKIESATIYLPRYNQKLWRNSDNDLIEVTIYNKGILSMIESNMKKDYRNYKSGEYYYPNILVEGYRENGDKFKTYATENISEEIIEKIIEYLSLNEDFVNKFYWEDFSGKSAHSIFIGNVVDAHSSKVVSFSVPKEVSELFDDYDRDIKKDLTEMLSSEELYKDFNRIFNSYSQLSDQKFSMICKIYFKNGNYYIFGTPIDNSDLQASVYDRINSLSYDNLGKRIEIYGLYDSEDAEKRYISKMIKYGIDLYKNYIDFSKIKTAETGNGDIAFLLNYTFGNFYDISFINRELIYDNFGEWYDKELKKVLEQDKIYVNSVDIAFERYYYVNEPLYNAFNNENSRNLFSELSKYFMKYEDAVKLSEKQTLSYKAELSYSGSLFEVYFPINSETTAILSKYMVFPENYFEKELQKYSEIDMIKINNVEITDKDDLNYLKTAFLLSFNDISGGILCLYTNTNIDSEENETLAFTDKMLEFLKDKYGLVPDYKGDGNPFTIIV